MVNEPFLDAITIDDRGRLALEISDQGETRSYEFDLSIQDLHTLARYAIGAARHRISDGLTVLHALDTQETP